VPVSAAAPWAVPQSVIDTPELPMLQDAAHREFQFPPIIRLLEESERACLLGIGGGSGTARDAIYGVQVPDPHVASFMVCNFCAKNRS
jgi:hypothetical protein